MLLNLANIEHFQAPTQHKQHGCVKYIRFKKLKKHSVAVAINSYAVLFQFILENDLLTLCLESQILGLKCIITVLFMSL